MSESSVRLQISASVQAFEYAIDTARDAVQKLNYQRAVMRDGQLNQDEHLARLAVDMEHGL